MSSTYRESSHESLQRFLTTPTSAATPNSTASTVTEYDENEPAWDKADAWIEPPLKAPTPSFQDDGLEGTDLYVFQYMAPLGHLPSARLIREIKAQELEYFVGQNKRKQNTSSPASTTTNELGSSCNGLRQQSTAASLHIRANGPTVSNGRRKNRQQTPTRIHEAMAIQIALQLGIEHAQRGQNELISWYLRNMTEKGGH